MFTKGLDDISDMLDSTFTLTGSISDINVSMAGRGDSESQESGFECGKKLRAAYIKTKNELSQKYYISGLLSGGAAAILGCVLGSILNSKGFGGLKKKKVIKNLRARNRAL